MGRKMSVMKWMLIGVLSGTLLAYTMIKNPGKSSGGEQDSEFQVVPFIMVFAKILLACVCGVFGERCFTQFKIPFVVQMSCTFLLGAFWCVVCAPFFLWVINGDALAFTEYGLFGGRDGGFKKFSKFWQNFKFWILNFNPKIKFLHKFCGF